MLQDRGSWQPTIGRRLHRSCGHETSGIVKHFLNLEAEPKYNLKSFWAPYRESQQRCIWVLIGELVIKYIGSKSGSYARLRQMMIPMYITAMNLKSLFYSLTGDLRKSCRTDFDNWDIHYAERALLWPNLRSGVRIGGTDSMVWKIDSQSLRLCALDFIMSQVRYWSQNWGLCTWAG